MEDLTGIEIAERHRTLEEASASLLGRLLFEFSYLDTNLGLCLVWVDGGRQLEPLSSQVNGLGFNGRLTELQRKVDAAFEAGSKAHAAYSGWLLEAHNSRRVRNELVHGRWGVDARRYEVINVVGLPTSSEQRENRYTLAELEGHVSEVKRLTKQLNRLRDRWRL